MANLTQPSAPTVNYGPSTGGLINSPEWRRWVSEGRATNPADYSAASAAAMMNQAAQLRKEDVVLNYYELATGKKGDQSTIEKFARYSDDPALLAAAINKEASLAPAQGGFKDQINAAVTEKMGRPATEAELGYFGKQMEQGNLDAYGLGEVLSGTTEYQTKASDTARGKLATELGGVDTNYLNKIQGQLESKYASAGRPGASAFGSSLIKAGKDMATERTGYLAGLGYQDFQQGQGNLTAAYQNRLAQMYANNQNVATAQNTSAQRYYSQQDYDRQQAAQERLARLSKPKQGSFLQGLAPGLVQGGLGLVGSYLGRSQNTTNNYGGW